MRKVERAVSLRVRIAISFSLLLLVMSVAAAWVLVRFESTYLAREEGKRVRSLAQNLAANARDPLLAGEELRLGPMVEAILMGEDVNYAYLTDHRGRVAYHTNPALLGKEAPPPGSNVLEERSPVKADGVVVGQAVVAIRKEAVREALFAVLARLFPLLLAATVIGIGGILLLSGHHAGRLEDLEQAVTAVGMGDLSVRVAEAGGDEVARLARHFNRMVAKVEESQRTVERTFRETVSALAAAVEAKDAYTRGHCERVARISREVGRRIGLLPYALGELELAAILHDVGKIGMEDRVLGKEGSLEKGEWDLMKSHTEVGWRILSPLSSMRRVGLYVRHHHENWDGTGYPAGLRGEEIPLSSRIIALVDAFDAMCTNRAYRPALSREEATRRLHAAVGSQFDPLVAEVFFLLRQDGVLERILAEVGGEEG